MSGYPGTQPNTLTPTWARVWGIEPAPGADAAAERRDAAPAAYVHTPQDHEARRLAQLFYGGGGFTVFADGYRPLTDCHTGDGPASIRNPPAREVTMALDFIGIDPDTPNGGSPTVWLETETEEFIFQGVTADDELNARISEAEWVPGHEIGIPAHESVVRIPVRMLPVIREACDAAERAGLFRPTEGSPEDGRPSGDA